MYDEGLTADERRVLAEAYRQFEETGTWPTYRRVERALVKELDVDAAMEKLEDRFGRPFNLNPDTVLVPPVGALAAAGLATAAFDSAFSALAVLKTRFLDASDEPRITMGEILAATKADPRHASIIHDALYALDLIRGWSGQPPDPETVYRIEAKARRTQFEDATALTRHFRSQAEDETRARAQRAPRLARAAAWAQPGAREDDVAVESGTCFVLMWMDPENPELTDAIDAIKATCQSFGVRATRADDVQHSGKITEVILERIRASEFIIADLTGERPNVYYEVGYAHALDKRPILVRKRGTRIHFDLADYNVIEYASFTELKAKLRERLGHVTGKTAKTPD